jgi:long-chain fatty acid transport protein
MSTAAQASGYLVARFGADHGSPSTANPYAVYFNPAAMGGTEGTNLTLEVAPLWRTVNYTRTPDALGNAALRDPDNTSPAALRYRDANTGKATLNNALVLGYLGATSDLGLKSPLRVGYSAYVPYGGMASWDKRSDAIASDPLVPGAKDSVARWHNITGKILAIYNTAAVSYTFESLRLSVGANASLVYQDIDTVRARNIPDQNDNVETDLGQLQEGRTRLVAHGLQAGAALGVYWEPLEDRSLALGLSYTSRPGFVGENRLAGELTAQAASNPGVQAPQKVDFLHAYPDLVRLGATYRVSQALELRADGEWVRWSSYKRQCVVSPGASCDINSDGSATDKNKEDEIVLNVPRNFMDAVGVRAGAGVFLSDRTEVFGSAAFSTSAIPKNNVDPAAIDSFRIYGTLGGRFRLLDQFALAASANVIHFLPFTVDAVGAARTDQLKTPSRSPSANGRYSSEVLFLNVNGTVTF